MTSLSDATKRVCEYIESLGHTGRIIDIICRSDTVLGFKELRVSDLKTIINPPPDPDVDLVPRSRLNAVENELTEAKRKMKTVQDAAFEEINRLSDQIIRDSEKFGIESKRGKRARPDRATIESEEFYNLMQTYRHADKLCDNPASTVQAYQAVIAHIDARLNKED